MSVDSSLPRQRAAVPLFALLASGVGVVGLFAHTWSQLAALWRADANYSHGWLIPLLAAYPAWRCLRRAGMPAEGAPLLGLLYLVCGAVCHLAAQVILFPPVDFVALVLVLRGLAVLAGGRAWANGLTFSILFLFFMFPLPVKWTGYAALWLQESVSVVSAWVLDPIFTCYRRGNTLQLAGVTHPLVVAEECSGLRQIVAFFACGTYYAYFSRRPTSYRVVLVLAAIPVAILANVLRVVLMATGAVWFGLDWMDGPLHTAPALFSIPAGLSLYALVGWQLGRFWPAAPAEGPP